MASCRVPARRLVRDGAEDRVAHHQRRLDRVEDDDRLAALGAADDLEGREVVSVNSSMLARVPGPADLLEIEATISAYGTGDDAGDGVDHRGRRLATAGDHVDVHRVEVLVEVDRRQRYGPDGRGGQVDGEDAGLGVARCVRAVRVGRGGLEDDVGQLVLGEQPVDALVRWPRGRATGAAQARRSRVDADHPARVDHVAAAHQLEHQVGADVAGPDDGGGALELGQPSGP